MTDGAGTDDNADARPAGAAPVIPEEWPERTADERTAVVVRLCVVAAAIALLIADPGLAGDRIAASALVAGGLVYASVLGAAAVARRMLTGLWWTGFLIATAVLVGVLVRLLGRQLQATAVSRARADTEHERYLSERALRDRLVSEGQARLDGARVVLHEFRTPVASPTALSSDLAADRLSDDARHTATRLLADHAVHLRDMLDGLADLAVSDGSPLGRVRPRPVVLAELAAGVLDAAAVAGHRRRAVVDPPDAAVRCDPQRLRRLLTVPLPSPPPNRAAGLTSAADRCETGVTR